MLIMPTPFLYVPAAGFTDYNDLPVSKQIWVMDPAAATIWTDTDGGTVAGNGDGVKWVENLWGSVNFTNFNAAANAVYRTSPQPHLECANARFFLGNPTGADAADCEFFAVVSLTSNYVRLAQAPTGSEYFGEITEGTGAPDSGVGTPTYYVGTTPTLISPANGGTLASNYVTTSKIVVSVRALDLTDTSWGTEMYIFSNGATWNISGNIYLAIMTKGLTAGERSDLLTYLGGI